MSDAEIYLHKVAKQAGWALSQTKAVTPCEHHKGVLLHNDDKDAERRAYFLADRWLKQEGVMGVREDLQDAIKVVLDGAAKGGCPECAHQKES